MANATETATGRMEGQPPTLEWISVERLQIDERYQRGVELPKSRAVIYGMVKCWDWRLCQPLNVSRRYDGTLFVVDGQHRLEGARRRGDLPHLPCVVSYHADHSDEAQTFVALNSQRQKLSQGDVFNASLASGDVAAQQVLEIVSSAGLSFARSHTPASWKPGQLFCGPALMKALKLYGPRVVSCALCALGEAYSGDVLVRGATLLGGLYNVYAEHAAEADFDPDRFIQALGSVEQLEWVMRAEIARSLRPGMSSRAALAVAFMDQYRDQPEVAD